MGHKESSTWFVDCWGLLKIDTVAEGESRVLEMSSSNVVDK